MIQYSLSSRHTYFISFPGHHFKNKVLIAAVLYIGWETNLNTRRDCIPLAPLSYSVFLRKCTAKKPRAEKKVIREPSTAWRKYVVKP
jgi:hypothetical protein